MVRFGISGTPIAVQREKRLMMAGCSSTAAWTSVVPDLVHKFQKLLPEFFGSREGPVLHRLLRLAPRMLKENFDNFAGNLRFERRNNTEVKKLCALRGDFSSTSSRL